MNDAAVQKLTRFVFAYRRRLIAGRIQRAALLIAATFLTLTALLQALFAFLPLTLLPLLFDAGAAVAVLLIAAHIFYSMVLKAPGVLDVARSIESRLSGEKTFLSLSLELARNWRTCDNPFTGAACERALQDLPALPTAPPPWRRRLPAGAYALLLGLWCLTTPLLSPRLLDYWDLPLRGVDGRGMRVEPGSVTVPQGASVTLKLQPSGVRFPSSRLQLSTAGGERHQNFVLRPDSSGAFVYRLDSVTSTFTYRFAPLTTALPPETVTVAPRPRLFGLNIVVIPPAYTRRQKHALAEGQGTFEAYIGSRVQVSITSQRLSRAWLLRGNDSLPLSVTGSSASGEMAVLAPVSYTFALIDTLGQTSDSLPMYRISAIPDEPPLVQIVRPGFNKILEPAQVETLRVEGVDDIGIRSMALKWRTGAQRAGTAGDREFPLKGVPVTAHLSFIWHLAELVLYPGDTVYYWAEARDALSRPGVSDTFWLRIPTVEERHEQRARNQEQAEKTLGAVRDKQGEIGRELERMVKAAARKNELSWEQKQILREVHKELEAQADSMHKALQSLERAIEQHKAEGAIGEEMARKFDEVRNAVEELTREYGDSLLFNLKDLEKPLSWREMRAAIEKVQSLLPKLEEQLDNVLKFLEMLKKDQKLAQLAMRAEELSKEQASLSRGERPADLDMARQQELLEAIRQLSEDAAEAAPGGTPESGGRVDSLRKSMQSALSRRQQPPKSSMNQMSGSLASLSQELMQMMQFNLADRMEEERKTLLALSRDALALADWQQELMGGFGASDDSVAARARGQQALKDAVKKSMDEADGLSMLPPDQMFAIGSGYKDALRASESVIDALASSDGGVAMSLSGSALRALANALLTALSAMENGQQSGGEGGMCMMPGLRKLSGRQAAINSMTAELLRQMLQGQESSPGQGDGEGREQARQEAQAAQQAIADELRKLAEEYGNEAGEGMRGRVSNLEEEARRMAAMLSRPSAEISERQDRFLARMLETTLSMHRQGEGREEWKSRTAENVFGEARVIDPGKAFKDLDAFHLLRLKAFGGNYPEGYRQALRAYFEALSERYLK
ncbi:MAG: hypothetical protein JXA71_15005 [Chitinispirillaceae bacterium]|nr:hypothetical protein [Chitinispirillaceae bacterium]